MGVLVSKLSALLNIKLSDPARVLLIGLDAAGKTTLLYKLKLGEVVSTVPTIGFNCEQLKYKNLEMTMWDVGGQTKIRRLWRYYYENTDIVIFVVDSADRSRLDEAAEELHNVLQDDMMRNVKLLVFANKHDMPQAMDAGELARGLRLNKLSQKWHVQTSNAVSGDGLYEGFDWAVNELKQR
nr:Arf1c [Gefionella okellyi]|eukprot:TRINITY_DN537_c0_g1_i2.p1 TRINITY_DN537_c0_g1~~TRINITY_DN537_c0_g1_i2.p1  ORF type:complete len:182 (+),score=47.17 TRINITY_DN537_c0_g1_i2:77-622(+)